MKKFVLTLLISLTFVLSIIPYAAIAEITGKYNGHIYTIINWNMSWDDARNYCESQGGHLATITSPDEQAFIESLNSLNKKLWIGGYRDDDFIWHWVTGEPWKYSN